MNRIINIFSLLINRIYELSLVTDKSKIKYLRSLGCKIGSSTRFVGNCRGIGSEPYLIEIGEDCLISDHVMFHTHDGGVKVLNTLGYFSEKNDKMGRIKVGNNCFIGSRTSILAGAEIGNNCIIGANSVVSKNIPDNSVAAGVPAKVICSIDEYYKKNKAQGRFYPSLSLSVEDKKDYLINNVK